MTSPAVTVRPAALVKEAARLMTEKRISALPVVDEAGGLLGIVSEADLIALETSPDPRSQATPLDSGTGPLPRTVAELMTRDVITTSEETDLGRVAQRMLEAAVKRLPVVRGGEVVGVVSRHDLLKVLARDDRAIESAVRAALAAEGQRMAQVQVTVDQGVARLSGPVDPRLQRIAEIVARSIPGVLQVRRD